MRKILCYALLAFVALATFPAHAKTVEYNLDIAAKTVNYTGKNVTALTVGGGIPAPTIEATVGDTLRVTFHNKMDVATSIHWHGILLPNDQDGVPYLTTQPIAARSSFTYEFPIIQHGTYWYHSHTGLQEQRGVYGALVFHPAKGEKIVADREKVLVFSDWTNESPDRVLHNLRKEDHYYARKKGVDQSWLAAIRTGGDAVKNRIKGAWQSMGVMDISDVGYDAFLVNGKLAQTIKAKPGEKIRLRMVNAAASSYFFVEYAGGGMQIVAADGVDTVPLTVDRLRMAIAETYDVIITVPEDGKAYELRATAEDGTGYSRTIIGNGKTVYAKDIPPPNPFMMSHDMHGMDDMGGMDMSGHEMDHSQHDTGMAMGGDMMDHAAMGHDIGQMMGPQRMAEYELLRSPEPTAFDENRPWREVPLALTGNMERYIWSFDNKTLSEADKILIRKGENVRFILKNETMMHHPIHLHGHFFRVLNGQGEYSPLKHTVNVPPMQTVVIEFAANEEKDWFFHCHNLYHMKMGMARVVSYEGSSTYDVTVKNKLAGDKHWYAFADTGLQTNMLFGDIRFENSRNDFHIEYDWDYEDEYDVDVVYDRHINRYFSIFGGVNIEQEVDDGEKDRDGRFIFGANLTLPLLIESEWRMDDQGHFRLGLGSSLHLTKNVVFDWDWNTDDEWRLQTEYEINEKMSLTGGRDSDYDWGVGLMVKF